MLAGIKYCGGCNPTYDRGAACATIRKAFEGNDNGSGAPDFEFVHQGDGKAYDVLLVINGCPCRCADLEGLVYERLITMWKPNQTEETIEVLRNALSKDKEV